MRNNNLPLTLTISEPSNPRPRARTILAFLCLSIAATVVSAQTPAGIAHSISAGSTAPDSPVLQFPCAVSVSATTWTCAHNFNDTHVFVEVTAGRFDVTDSGYRIPLERDARLLRDHMGKRCEVVLLGSVAAPKYVEPLLGIFGESLMFPQDFVGRGDMSRGGLLLRCVDEESELTHIPVAGAVRHGARPPRLPKLARRSEMTVVIPAAVR